MLSVSLDKSIMSLPVTWSPIRGVVIIVILDMNDR